MDFETGCSSVFKPREDFVNLNNNLTVCRCENVKVNDIKEAIKNGAFGPNQIKLFTRIGMGNCQGRQCSNSLTIILSNMLNKKENEIGILKASHIHTARDQLSSINSEIPLIINDFSYKINNYSERKCFP